MSDSRSTLASKMAFDKEKSSRDVGRKRKFVEAASNRICFQAVCSVCEEGEAKYKCPKCRSTYCSIACCRIHKEACLISPKTSGSTILPASDASTHGCTFHLPNPSHGSKYFSDPELQALQYDLKHRCKSLAELRQKLTDDQTNEDLGPAFNLSDEMVRSMKTSSWLQRELSDIGLQGLISKILSYSSDLVPGSRGGPRKEHNPFTLISYREKILSETKRTHPQFQAFLDKLLCLTGVYERRPLEYGCLVPLEEWLELDFSHSSNTGKECELILAPLPKKERASTGCVSNTPENETDSTTSSDDVDD